MTIPSIRTLIIDDEALARRRVSNLLSRHSNFNIIDQYDNGRKALDGILHHKPQLIFLDIEMPHLSGVELLEKVPVDKRPLTVFVTAYHSYAVDAFNLFAIDYLLKPFTEERFDHTISRILEKIQQTTSFQMQTQFEAMVNFMEQVGPPPSPKAKRLSIHLGNRIYFLNLEDIQYILGDGNYVNIYAHGTRHVLRETLSNMEKKLDGHSFVRIHKSTIVNIDYIQELKKMSPETFQVHMQDGRVLKISKSYKKIILQKFL